MSVPLFKNFLHVIFFDKCLLWTFWTFTHGSQIPFMAQHLVNDGREGWLWRSVKVLQSFTKQWRYWRTSDIRSCFTEIWLKNWMPFDHNWALSIWRSGLNHCTGLSCILSGICVCFFSIKWNTTEILHPIENVHVRKEVREHLFGLESYFFEYFVLLFVGFVVFLVCLFVFFSFFFMLSYMAVLWELIQWSWTVESFWRTWWRRLFPCFDVKSISFKELPFQKCCHSVLNEGKNTVDIMKISLFRKKMSLI